MTLQQTVMLVLILALVVAIEEIIRLSTRLRNDHLDRLQLRKEYLNKINTLPGNEGDYVRFINGVWGAMYPENPDGWDYPDQVIRHVGDVAHERNTFLKMIERIAGLVAENADHRAWINEFALILKELRGMRIPTKIGS